jgi:hypothetical protein
VGDATTSDGRLHVYDISNPESPLFVRSQGTVNHSSLHYRGLVAYGPNYLVGLSSDRPFGADFDVSIIDRTNVSSLSRVTLFGIVNFDAVDGFIEGTTLYAVGATGGIAVVDLTNPLAPVLRSTIDTPGVVRGVALSAPNEIVIADGSGGITFINVTDKSNPIVVASQRLPGNSTDVAVVGKGVFVASENYFHMIQRP